MSRGYLAVTVRALARVVAVSLGVALAATPADAAVTALTGGTIHDMRGGAPYVGTLVIDGTTISAVGANVTAPAGATVVDVSGLDIYPGLIDAQSTLGLTEIGAERDDLALVLLDQPAQDDRGIEPAAVGETDALHGRHGGPPAASLPKPLGGAKANAGAEEELKTIFIFVKCAASTTDPGAA